MKILFLLDKVDIMWEEEKPVVCRSKIQPLSKFLLHCTIVHQMFLCSMIGSELDLELVYKMAKLSVPKKQFAESYRRGLIQWRDNTNSMKKEYVKVQYCRLFKDPSAQFKAEIETFLEQASQVSKGFDVSTHKHHAIEQFETIFALIMKQPSYAGQQEAVCKKDMEIQSDQDIIWCFRQMKCLYFSLLLFANQCYMNFKQLSYFIPLKDSEQIKQKVSNQFGIDLSFAESFTNQEIVYLLSNTIHELSNFFELCYVQRGLSEKYIIEDINSVVQSSTKHQKLKGLCKRQAERHIKAYYLERACKQRQIMGQSNIFESDFTPLNFYLENNYPNSMILSPSMGQKNLNQN